MEKLKKSTLKDYKCYQRKMKNLLLFVTTFLVLSQEVKSSCEIVCRVWTTSGSLGDVAINLAENNHKINEYIISYQIELFLFTYFLNYSYIEK